MTSLNKVLTPLQEGVFIHAPRSLTCDVRLSGLNAWGRLQKIWQFFLLGSQSEDWNSTHLQYEIHKSWCTNNVLSRVDSLHLQEATTCQKTQQKRMSGIVDIRKIRGEHKKKPITRKTIEQLRDKLNPSFSSHSRSSSIFVSVFNIMCTSLDGTTLSIPFAIVKCGIVFGPLLVIILAVLSGTTLKMLCILARKSNAASYTELIQSYWCVRFFTAIHYITFHHQIKSHHNTSQYTTIHHMILSYTTLYHIKNHIAHA